MLKREPHGRIGQVEGKIWRRRPSMRTRAYWPNSDEVPGSNVYLRGSALCRIGPDGIAAQKSSPLQVWRSWQWIEKAKDRPSTPDVTTGRYYWLYRGRLYSTTESLTADDVVALLNEQENKKRMRIARARALQQQVGTPAGARAAIPPDARIFVWQRDQGRCVACGSNENLEFDHIIPVSLGGATTARNLQLLCEPCNRRKGAGLA
jgi:hypothetical protein